LRALADVPDLELNLTSFFSGKERPKRKTRASLDVKAMKLFHLYALISAQSMYVQSLYGAPSTKEFILN
jgi:hypothetical protein